MNNEVHMILVSSLLPGDMVFYCDHWFLAVEVCFNKAEIVVTLLSDQGADRGRYRYDLEFSSLAEIIRAPI